MRDGSCFLYRAKKQAEAAHVLVVNHALLLSDVATGGGNVLPEYQHLVIDEAHHLEEEATNQFGFSASEADLMAWLDRVHTRTGRDREGGFVATIDTATRVALQAIGPAPQLQALARTLAQIATRARDRVPPFFRALQQFGSDHSSGRNDYDERIMINRGMRVQPDWSDIEADWFKTEELLAERRRRARGTARGAVAGRTRTTCSITTPSSPRRPTCSTTARRCVRACRASSARTTARPICWLTMGRRDASPSLSSAPLSVAETLRAGLFGSKESVVLTSATLSTEDNFDYIKGRLGFEDSRELHFFSYIFFYFLFFLYLTYFFL